MLGTIFAIYLVVGLIYWTCRTLKQTPAFLRWVITAAAFIVIIPIGPVFSAYKQFKKGEKGWGWTMVVTSIVFYAVIFLAVYLQSFYKG